MIAGLGAHAGPRCWTAQIFAHNGRPLDCVGGVVAIESVRVTLSCCPAPAVSVPGLMVTERNWLLVYRWASWGGNSNLPAFVEGQQFQPSELTLRQGATAPPPRLSERDLIAAMERHGIGTDATVAGDPPGGVGV